MLSFFRAMAKSKITLVVLFLPLALGLLVFGNVNDVFSGMSGKDAVVATGERSVSSAEFKTYFDNAKRNQEQQSGGQPVSYEDAASRGWIEDIIESLANQLGFSAALDKAGLQPSDNLVAKQLKTLPIAHDGLGQFSQDAYQRWLASQGFTAKAFEQDLRDQIAMSHFTTALAAGLRTPPVYSGLMASLALEERTFAAFAINPATLPPPAKPTDAQLTTFINAHAKELTQPEARSMTVIRFSAAALTPGMPVNPADIQTRFDFRKDTLSTPEKRTVIQVPAPDAAKAAAVAARLNKGEDPAAVAKSMGVEAVTYSDTPKTGIRDARVGAAAFALPTVGQVSAPVQGDLAWAVVKVLAITPGKAVTLAEARPAIEAELKAEAAQQAVYDLVEKFQTAVEGGANLTEAARAVGATALQLPPVTAQGTDRRGQPQPLMSAALLKEAFGLAEGGESDVVTDGKGEYFAVKVDKIFPAALPSVAAEREGLTRAYMQAEMLRAVQTRVNALAERVRKGESIDAVAQSLGVAVQRQTLQRRMAEQAQGQSRQLLAMVFGAKPGEVLVAGAGVLKVEAIKIGSLQQAAVITRAAEPTVRRSVFQDLGEEAYRWARKEMKVKTDVNLARVALGLPPLETPKAAKK